MNHHELEKLIPGLLGTEEEMLLDLIKEHQPEIYQELLTDPKERKTFRRRMTAYKNQTMKLIHENDLPGGNIHTKISMAKEINWPQLCSQYGI